MEAARLEAIRRQFPVTRHCAYFNHAAMAAPPRAATDAVAALAASVSEGGDRSWPERNRRAEEVRQLAARLLGASAHEVAFVQNTSDALSVVAAGLGWRRGDNVVGALPEYPSNVYPWMQLGDLGVEYRQVPERAGRVDPDEILSRIDERTRVLALSWVQFASGFRSPLATLGRECRRRGVLFVVDAIQGLGALGLDVERDAVDVCAAATHKWLLGPEGLGILYVSDRVLGEIRPSRYGWRTVAGMFDWGTFDLTLNQGARRYECGTLNFLGIHCLGGALELLAEVGMETVEARVLALAGHVAEGLMARGFTLAADRRPGEESGIVAATHPGRPAAEIARHLAGREVIAAERLGRLRISPHFYNTEEEVQRLLAALDEL